MSESRNGKHPVPPSRMPKSNVCAQPETRVVNVVKLVTVGARCQVIRKFKFKAILS